MLNKQDATYVAMVLMPPVNEGEQINTVADLLALKSSIFTTPRHGLMGDKPLGAEYMHEVKERARRMKAATREQNQSTDKRQLRLPGF